jgi:NAD(P)-dependent dehydrogenase (short-subunit alcohol dehydrogenase family)
MAITTSRVVMVTGAPGGLGTAMTVALLQDGARVVATDLPGAEARMKALIDAASRIGAGERIFPVYGNVREYGDCERMVAEGKAHFGAVHALINNAGLGMETISTHIMSEPPKFHEVPVERWHAVMDTNVNGPYLMARAITPFLVEQGSGRIINIVTSTFSMIMKGFSPYGPSKAALEAATVVWSRDLEGTGVMVNALLPGGAANTTMVPNLEVPDRSTLVQPPVMGPPAVWLTSAASEGVTGQRVIAKEWNPQASIEENLNKAISPAGWQTPAPV